MELQRRYDDIRKQGLGLVAISYDSQDTLKAFAGSRGITFPLIADRDSAMIRAFGIFNHLEQPGARGYGIPHPGTFIVDRDGRLVGLFTDGDLRRLIEREVQNPKERRIDEVMTRNPRSIRADTFALEALALMHQFAVDQLPVVDAENRLLGLLDVQDLLNLKIG